MSEIEKLCQQFLETHDNNNLIHYIENHTVEEIGVTNIIKVLNLLDNVRVKIKNQL